MNTRSSAQKQNGGGPIGPDAVAVDELFLPVRRIQPGIFDLPSMNTRSSAQKRRGDDDHVTKGGEEEQATIRSSYQNRKRMR
jgi:hypothetical protein